MKTALNQLMERVEFIKLYYENELTLNYEPHVKQILDGKLSVTENILKEIESLLPAERETTETLKKEIQELRNENEKIFEVDFGNHLRTKIKVIGSNIEVLAAMNGWGDGVPLEDIKIKTFPAPPKTK